jgi:16S rRNA (adenine1518-N6/adenine1519-N6)-dimethyltransferase
LGSKPMRIKAKQSLGQNFLIDRNVARKIVVVADFGKDDVVVEIGAGQGVLTRLLAPKVKQLIAIEIDRHLATRLQDDLLEFDNVDIIHTDFLKNDLAMIGSASPLRIIGNIPYHITSPIIFKVLESVAKIRDMVLMMQREVAERIVAPPGGKAYGILSVISQAHADVKILSNIPPTVFQPQPKVDSSLVRWTFTSKRLDKIKDREFFRQVVRRAFGQRRKMLRNSLSDYVDCDTSLPVALENRPEHLTVEQWIDLANVLGAVKK